MDQSLVLMYHTRQTGAQSTKLAKSTFQRKESGCLWRLCSGHMLFISGGLPLRVQKSKYHGFTMKSHAVTEHHILHNQRL